MATKENIVLFDFDGTLIHADSFLKFARKVCGLPHFCCVMLVHLPMLVMMCLRLTPRDVAKQRLFSAFFKGMDVERFRQLGRNFAQDVDGWIRRAVYECAQDARKQGKDVYVVTASIEDWVRPWCEKQGFLCVGTRAEVDAGGHLTGLFVGRNCRADEKVRRISEMLPKPRSCYHVLAYGDSEGDRELLAWADEGILISCL